MRAGRLNRVISIRKPTTGLRSTSGEPIITWTTVLDEIWADKQPVSAREMFSQDERWSDVSVKFITRYSTLVTPTCKLIDIADSSAEYDIRAVINIKDRNQGMELLARKVE